MFLFCAIIEGSVISKYQVFVCQMTSGTIINFNDYYKMHNYRYVGAGGEYTYIFVSSTMYFSLLYGCTSLLFDLFEVGYLVKCKIISGCSLRSILKRYMFNTTIVNTQFYRVVIFLLSINFIMTISTDKYLKHLTSKINTTNETVQTTTSHEFESVQTEGNKPNFNRLLSLRYCFTSGIISLGFIQIGPSTIGFFAFGFQKMLVALGKFAVLQFVITGVFTLLFQFVRTYSCTSGRDFTCREESHMYLTFLIMLNMYDVIPDAECSQYGLYMIQIIHIYLYITSITSIK